MLSPLDGPDKGAAAFGDLLATVLAAVLASGGLSPEARAAVARLLADPTAGGLEAEAPNGPTDEQLLTVEQVATLLQMHKSTVYKKVRQDPRWRQAARRIGPGMLRFDLPTLRRTVIRPN
jgi:predicted DNA-binding transcriptional regulator AlpA